MNFSSSVTSNFLTYGTDGIGVSRSMERRAAERHANAVASALGTSSPMTTIRHWLGDHLVGVHVEVDPDERLDRAEPQADLPQGQQRHPRARAHDLTCSSLGTYLQ